MKIQRGLYRPTPALGCALTIGNFDGVHRGHQAMLSLLQQQARVRGLPTCVLTFEPHPRDYFAVLKKQPDLAPARISTLRDKLCALAEVGIDQTVILPFNAKLASLSSAQFVQLVLLQGLGAKYVLAGDDFRFGASRLGDYALLEHYGTSLGFEVERMQSYAVQDLRVSSTEVRQSIQAADMNTAAKLLGRPYAISGRVMHGRKLGREMGFPTLNLRFAHWKPVASGIFVVRIYGLTDSHLPLQGVANLGTRPSIHTRSTDDIQVLLETHCLQWPQELGPNGGYGKIVRVELLHKLHNERKYDSLLALKQAIAQDCADARAWFALHYAETLRQITSDRII